MDASTDDVFFSGFLFTTPCCFQHGICCHEMVKQTDIVGHFTKNEGTPVGWTLLPPIGASQGSRKPWLLTTNSVNQEKIMCNMHQCNAFPGICGKNGIRFHYPYPPEIQKCPLRKKLLTGQTWPYWPWQEWPPSCSVLETCNGKKCISNDHHLCREGVAPPEGYTSTNDGCSGIWSILTRKSIIFNFTNDTYIGIIQLESCKS